MDFLAEIILIDFPEHLFNTNISHLMIKLIKVFQY